MKLDKINDSIHRLVHGQSSLSYEQLQKVNSNWAGLALLQDQVLVYFGMVYF